MSEQLGSAGDASLDGSLAAPVRAARAAALQQMGAFLFPNIPPSPLPEPPVILNLAGMRGL